MPMSASTMSGGDDSRRSMAWSPSLTAMTLTSSSAKVSSMTRWIVTLSSASKRVCGTFVLSAIQTSDFRLRSGIGVDEFDDLLHRRPRQKDSSYTDFLQLRDVHVRNDPTDHDQDIVEPFLLEQLHQPRRDVIVCTRENRQADDVGVLLQRRRGDHFRRLAQSGIDDFHAGVAQRARDDFRAAIVAVEAGLRDDDAD